jgi:choline-glycine betaine transporter
VTETKATLQRVARRRLARSVGVVATRAAATTVSLLVASPSLFAKIPVRHALMVLERFSWPLLLLVSVCMPVPVCLVVSRD